MALQSLVHLLTVQPFQLFFALISGIFQFLFSLTARNKPKRRSSSQSRQMKTEIELNGANLYEEFSILVEQCLCVSVAPYNNYSNGATSNSTRAWIGGNKWEFTVCRNSNSQNTLRLALVEMDLALSGVTAEILFWQWHRGKQVYILQKYLKCFQQPCSQVQFQFNSGSANLLPSDGFFNVLIRQLGKRQSSMFGDKSNALESIPTPSPSPPPFPAFETDQNVTLIVGPEQFVVSRHYLIAVSPVFQRMFSIEMREKARGEVILEETSPEEFRAFLEAISPGQVHPNPYNVHELLKLADRFQCELLRDRCEGHLLNCVEIALIERLLCAEIYRLEKLKNYILKSLTGPGLRDFYEENQNALNMLSKDLLIQLTSRICTSVKVDRSSLCQNCQRDVNH